MLNTTNTIDHEKSIDAGRHYDFPVDVIAPDFIYHPKNALLKTKPLKQFPELDQDEIRSGKSTLGLCFTSRKHHATGTILEITIPVRGDDHKFVGQVVLVRKMQHGYETGIWLRSQTDACRARILEQICYIDGYLEEKQVQSETPINAEQEIQGWISRNAALFPA